MAAALLAVYVVSALPLPGVELLPLAYCAGLAAALVFSIYHASHARGKGARLPRAWLTWRCMGCSWNSKEVTIPKLPPPPRTPQ